MMSITPRSTSGNHHSSGGNCVSSSLPSDTKSRVVTMSDVKVLSPPRRAPHERQRTIIMGRQLQPQQQVSPHHVTTRKMSTSKTCNSSKEPPQVMESSSSRGLCRTKTLLSFTGGGAEDTSSLLSDASSTTRSSSESLDTMPEGSLSSSSWEEMSERDHAHLFGCDTRTLAQEGPVFHKNMREAMEPHLREARVKRELTRQRHLDVMNVMQQQHHHDAIASSVGVPYTDLRKERRFLFDEYTHPLHTLLADTLGMELEHLSRLHELEHVDDQMLLEPLLNRHKRQVFQECYDSFVTSFCIPLLHSLAMQKNLFHSMSSSTREGGSSSKISYRYQAFPCIRILRPGDCLLAPQCDVASGHSVGNLCFHIPITPAFGTNALYAESHPGREDWHPFTAKAFGLGYLFDGARCLHYTFENTTPATSVWLDFRIAIYNEHLIYSPLDGSGLCTKAMLEDSYSRSGPGYYDEAAIDLSVVSSSFQFTAVAAKKRAHGLLEPDARVGVPFCRR